MNPIYPNDLPPADDLTLSFDSIHEPTVPPDRELEPFLQGLERYAGDWMPDVAWGKGLSEYSRAAVLRALDEARERDKTGVGLYRTKLPAIDGSLEFGPGSECRAYFRMKPLSFFEAEDRCRSLINVVRAWAEHLPVKYAYATAGDELKAAVGDFYGSEKEWWPGDAPDKVYDLTWLNVFGPRVVENVGRQRMLSTPAHLVEEFSSGAVLIVIWPLATEFARDEARQAQARAMAHLRPDLDHEKILRVLRARSAKLVPLERNFDPDLEPLLTRMVKATYLSGRNELIAELNALRPPEPEEWLPADAAPLSDVPDREAALRLIDAFADGVPHIFYKQMNDIPDIVNKTPGALTDIDYTLWLDAWPSSHGRKKMDSMVQPIGAYLGEVLVRHLGGAWIPRKKMEESQVRVGKRVWLPFVRAWRYLRSDKSLLSYSLTQLYRAVERHRS